MTRYGIERIEEGRLIEAGEPEGRGPDKQRCRTLEEAWALCDKLNEQFRGPGTPYKVVSRFKREDGTWSIWRARRARV